MNQNFTRQTTSLWEWDVEKGNYNTLGGNTFALVVVWGHSNGSTGRLSSDHVTFGCVKADKKTDVSAWPSECAGLGVPFKWLASFVLAAAMLISL